MIGRKTWSRNTDKLKTASAMLLMTFFCLVFISSVASAYTATTLGDHGNVTVMEVTGNYDANLADYHRYLPNGTYVPIYPSDAENITRSELRTKPFFKKGSNDALFTEEGGSNYALQNRIKLLAEAFPARTLAAGKEIVAALTQTDGINVDMQTSYKTKKNVNGSDMVFWPIIRGKKENWWHGDARNVAYSYVYTLFDKFVVFGGLK